MYDKTVANAYFYDMFFLFDEEKYSFEDDYLQALGDGKNKFDTLLKMSLNDPSFKSKAKELYADSAKFNEYWLAAFNQAAKPAPFFSMLQLDGSKYSLQNHAGQWTLIDFWGTWCGPCREEHPDLENFFKLTKDGKLANLNIITIASQDSESKVKAYMREFNYTFPVVMSDDQVEKDYHVSSWPSKFLVSPQGKCVIIPFNVNWRKYVTDYMN